MLHARLLLAVLLLDARLESDPRLEHVGLSRDLNHRAAGADWVLPIVATRTAMQYQINALQLRHRFIQAIAESQPRAVHYSAKLCLAIYGLRRRSLVVADPESVIKLLDVNQPVLGEHLHEEALVLGAVEFDPRMGTEPRVNLPHRYVVHHVVDGAGEGLREPRNIVR